MANIDHFFEGTELGKLFDEASKNLDRPLASSHVILKIG